MRTRLFNRLAQRYLLSGGDPLPIIGRPGTDPADSTEWEFVPGDASGTFDLRSGRSNPRYLLINGGELLFDDRRPRAGSWVLDSVGGTSGYRFIVSTDDRRLALATAMDKHGSEDAALTLRAGRDRGSMWLPTPDCVADARSIHLRYDTPGDLVLIYNEVYPEQTPPGTYLCTSGFGANARSREPSGYGGIQRRIDGSMRAIFSVWHQMANEVRPVPGSLATVVAAHSAAQATDFSGEGSGCSIRMPIDWRSSPGRPVRFCITAEPLGPDTVLTAYLALGDAPWVSIGAIVRSATGGSLMRNPYAFVEDYARTGNIAGTHPSDRSPFEVHSATFANPWFVGESRQLTPTRRVKVTAYSPHLLENLSAERTAEGTFGVRMATGGSWATDSPPIGTTIEDAKPGSRLPPDLSGIPYLA